MELTRPCPATSTPSRHGPKCAACHGPASPTCKKGLPPRLPGVSDSHSYQVIRMQTMRSSSYIKTECSQGQWQFCSSSTCAPSNLL